MFYVFPRKQTNTKTKRLAYLQSYFNDTNNYITFNIAEFEDECFSEMK